LPALAAEAVQVATGTLVVVTAAGQVVVVQPFPELAAAAVQVATGTLVVLFVLHVVVIKLGETGPEAVQVCTGTFVVLFVLQVVAVQLLPAVADPATQLATGTLVVTTVWQVPPPGHTCTGSHNSVEGLYQRTCEVLRKACAVLCRF